MNPLVSFIMPTYNAEQYLESCLKSIFNLEDKNWELIVADGGSTDNTLEILKKYDVKVLYNPKQIAEYGKYVAFKQARGEFIVLIDSDDVIASKDWLTRLLIPFEDSHVVGVESHYLIAKDFSTINKYSNLLVIVDPLARLLATKPFETIHKDLYSVKRYIKGSSPISGANGFIWRKDILKNNIEEDELNESLILNKLCKYSDLKIANVKGVGIYHYYAESLTDYIQKRKKIANKHLARKQERTTWVDDGSKLKFLISAIYLASFVGPMMEAFFKLIKTRRVSWLWHPVVSLLTIFIYTKIYIQSKTYKAKHV